MEKLKIYVCGRGYSISTSDSDNQQELEQAVYIINKIIDKKSKQPNIYSEGKLALITAVEIAIDFLKTNKLLKRYQEKELELISKIDNSSS